MEGAGGVLYLIGLGLGGENDITVAGLAAVQSCDEVFLEAYTSVLPGVSSEDLARRYGKPVTVADRRLVEQGEEAILGPVARGKRVAFLVVGDPFGATTHSDLHWRATERGLRVRVVHNTSILNAAGCCGLQLYRFGQTVSITFLEGSVLPRSTYDKIASNAAARLHTLALLDIKVPPVKEQTVENLLKGNNKYEPPRFMTVAQAAGLLLRMEAEFGGGVCGPEARAVGLARVGHESQVIRSGTLAELKECDLGAPLHTLVLAGELHPEELKWYEHYRTV